MIRKWVDLEANLESQPHVGRALADHAQRLRALRREIPREVSVRGVSIRDQPRQLVHRPTLPHDLRDRRLTRNQIKQKSHGDFSQECHWLVDHERVMDLMLGAELVDHLAVGVHTCEVEAEQVERQPDWDACEGQANPQTIAVRRPDSVRRARDIG
jgi:hypothetical protein